MTEQNTTNLIQTSSAEIPMRVGPGRIKRRRRLPADAKVERRLKRFIQDILNETGENIRYIFSGYAKFFPATSQAKDAVAFLPRIADRLPNPVLHCDEQALRRAIVEELRDRLRAIWFAENESTARWRLFKLRFDVWLGSRPVMNRETHPDSKDQESLPLDEPIQQALHCLERNLHKLKRCENPECKTPFFIADKGTRRYCSVGTCASGAQAEWKRRWWQEQGNQWRKAKRRQRKRGTNPKPRTR